MGFGNGLTSLMLSGSLPDPKTNKNPPCDPWDVSTFKCLDTRAWTYMSLNTTAWTDEPVYKGSAHMCLCKRSARRAASPGVRSNLLERRPPALKRFVSRTCWAPQFWQTLGRIPCRSLESSKPSNRRTTCFQRPWKDLQSFLKGPFKEKL